ncbi:nitric oxide synthase oxygenase [Halalkalibacillus halophilus]|uniref:nitric oxide synthase oxygenase n=1 Tax=Halalkalibacillus halophilus TaxID=392827 RepID=UPI000411D5DD|nr:nitric oxide synthase oxygenase [Halalkalibacillus halophilus]
MSALHEKAISFITQMYDEKQYNSTDLHNRIEAVCKEIASTGSYSHTYDELNYGAKMAWRNSNKCIGRLFWDTLNVFDYRDETSPDQIFKRIKEHLEFATNDGKIKSTVSVFPPKSNDLEIRILNHQLIRYAGYETNDGIIGDSDSISFTKKCMELGWSPKYGSFDLLPIVIQVNNETPRLYELPHDIVMEVNLSHPSHDWFKDIGLKWYAVPVISDMQLEIGGIEYNAAPFNGWYMVTEIGARNFADDYRYDMLPVIAENLELTHKSNRFFWQDHALVVLNEAVLFSYQEAGVSMVDHHTAATQFKQFEKNELKSSRCPTGDWSWLVPPIAGASTHLFHKPYDNTVHSPNFFYQQRLY